MTKDSRPDSTSRPPGRARRAIRWLDEDDGEHPARLLGRSEIRSPLSLRGALKVADRTAVAVVGTRQASPYGETIARRLGRALARRQVTVVSGGARGIDCAAHEAALQAGGRTIAVLGEGLDAAHPMAAPELVARIADSGAVLSEFEPDTPPRRWQFPRRNRLLVALAERVVVVEAPRKSGAMISARLARQLDRSLYAVPGPCDHPNSAGPHQLIREGATLLDDPEAFAAQVRPGPGDPRGDQQRPDSAGLGALLRSGPVSPDEVAATLGLQAREAAVLLLELELRGEVRRLPGGRYETG